MPDTIIERRTKVVTKTERPNFTRSSSSMTISPRANSSWSC